MGEVSGTTIHGKKNSIALCIGKGVGREIGTHGAGGEKSHTFHEELLQCLPKCKMHVFFDPAVPPLGIDPTDNCCFSV